MPSAAPCDRAWQELGESIQAYNAGHLCAETLLAMAWPLLLARARRLTRRYGFNEADAEDVAQDVLIALPGKIASQLDPELPVEPFLNAWLFRTGATLWRQKTKEQPFTDLESTNEDDSLPAERFDQVQVGVDAAHDLDRAAALARYNELRAHYGAPRPIIAHKAAAKAPRHAAKAAQLADHADHDELKTILHEVKISRESFAGLLGIGKPRLISYLYKHTRSVPQEVMHKARQVRVHLKSEADGLLERYKRPISHLLAEWIESYGLPDHNNALAEIFQVDPVTIKRWRRDLIKPGLRKSQQYEQLAALWARKKPTAAALR